MFYDFDVALVDGLVVDLDDGHRFYGQRSSRPGGSFGLPTRVCQSPMSKPRYIAHFMYLV